MNAHPTLDHNYVKKLMELTHILERCKIQFEKTEELYGYKQLLFPIVQGGTYENLRKYQQKKLHLIILRDMQ